MTESSPTPENAYASGPVEATIVDGPPPRPIGTVIVAIFLLLGAVLVGMDRGYWYIQVYSSGGRVVLERAFYVVFAREAVTVVTAILGGVGLLIGTRWGWWTAMVQCYWRLSIQAIFPILGALLLPSAADAALGSAQTMQVAMGSGVVFVSIVVYLQKKSVVTYVRVAPAQRLVANVVVLAGCIGLMFGLYAWRATMR
ncbi:MAG: hypothetical protein NTW96_09935 [Planctomycetia bacterium]|nr:hypothetical protein [Planctomycetia bacterium]